MKFEPYAREWLSRQTLIKSTRKTTRQSMEVYAFPVIGQLEIADITENDIDEIFFSERLFNRKGDFMERVFRVLLDVFDELVEEQVIQKSPVDHIFSPIVLSHEKFILDGKTAELTNRSMFVDVSCTWLKSKRYGEVTYNLYYHFLHAFIHPFIGKIEISLINQGHIRRIYTYFNTVSTNETWIGQMHLVMRMVFEFAIEKGLIASSPLERINDPHLTPILLLDRDDKNAVRAAFNQYGFRKNRLKELSRALFTILLDDEDEGYSNSQAVRKNNISFQQVFEEWHRNTQDGILSEATASASFHSMDVYTLPNFGSKPIQKVSPADMQAVLDVYALMGNTADFYILGKMRSLYSYAAERGYVSRNIAYDFKSDNNPAAVKTVLSDNEIKRFFFICDEMNCMDSYMLAIVLCTGIRIREAMATSHSLVDLELGTLKIKDQIKDGRLTGTTKTRAGRKIQLSRTVLAYLEAAREKGEQFKRRAGYNNQYDLIFTNEDGSPLSYTNVNRKLDEIARRLNRPDLTAHTLRHTRMTIASRCGEGLDEIQNEVGHGFASDVITEYLHQTEESIHESAEKRQNYLEGLMRRYEGESADG